MRRKSFAKYRIAASANSPSDALKTPAPLVRGTALSFNSGNSVLSSPTERECTQSKLGHIANTSLINGSEPDQLKSTLASAAAPSKTSAEFPTIILTSASCRLSIASCASAGSAVLTSTRIVSFLIVTGGTAQEITPQSKQPVSKNRHLENRSLR